MALLPTRRTVLHMLLLIPASLAWGAGSTRAVPAARDIERLLGGRASARRLGRRYLELHPAERDRDALLRAVGPRTSAELRERVRADFREGETVILAGWVLSRTELRLCAIVALS